MLVGVMPYNRPFAIVMIALSVIIGAVGTALTYIDQERFKVAQMVLYMVLGWMCLVLIYPLWKYCEDALPLIGLILYLCWKDQQPLKAKSCGKGALIGVIVEVGLSIIFAVFAGALFAAIAGSLIGEYGSCAF